jgi:hypothetical protein
MPIPDGEVHPDAAAEVALIIKKGSDEQAWAVGDLAKTWEAVVSRRAQLELVFDEYPQMINGSQIFTRHNQRGSDGIAASVAVRDGRRALMAVVSFGSGTAFKDSQSGENEAISRTKLRLPDL